MLYTAHLGQPAPLVAHQNHWPPPDYEPAGFIVEGALGKHREEAGTALYAMPDGVALGEQVGACVGDQSFARSGWVDHQDVGHAKKITKIPPVKVAVRNGAQGSIRARPHFPALEPHFLCNL